MNTLENDSKFYKIWEVIKDVYQKSSINKTNPSPKFENNQSMDQDIKDNNMPDQKFTKDHDALEC